MVLNETLITAAIGLASGLIGFIAGQAYTLAKEIYREKKLKAALVVEVEEARPWLSRNIITLECMIQLCNVHEFANNGPIPVPIQVHAEHFPQVNLKLSRGERVSFYSIYNLLYLVNSTCEKLRNLQPVCVRDPSKTYEFAQLLDNMYRNTYHAVLLINLHLEHRNDLDALTSTNETDQAIKQLHAQNDSRLLQLAAEAKAMGAKAIREKYDDGAVTVADVQRTPVPVPGRFYFDLAGSKYKCISVINGLITWMLLDSKIGPISVDAVLRQKSDKARHYYEITDRDEIDRLQRRVDLLMSSQRQAKPPDV